MHDELSAKIKTTADFIRSRSQRAPNVGVILGSGLSQLVDHINDATVISYNEIPDFPTPSVPGHKNELVLGELAGVALLALRGRFHFYEGYTMQEVTLPVRVMQALGVDTLIVTNAAGGLNADWQVGNLMCIRDHIFLPGMAGMHPLRGPNNDRWGLRFPPMLNAYDGALGAMAQAAASRVGATLREGVYAMVSGPSFETGAEMTFLRTLGADAVGMSTAPEVIVARHAGMRVLGISLITNIAHPDASAANHEEVLAAGEAAKPMFSALITDVLRQISVETTNAR